jgi:hypothetical protein
MVRHRASRGRRRVACASLALLIGSVPVERARAQANEPPAIRHDPLPCGRVAQRVRVCAYVVDDSGIALVRLSFRARGARGYHWTPMAFDGALYCAWLPATLAETRAVEYYVEAVDDNFEPSRSADQSFVVRDDCPTLPQQAPDAPAVVGATAPDQPLSPEGFDPATFKTP